VNFVIASPAPIRLYVEAGRSNPEGCEDEVRSNLEIASSHNAENNMLLAMTVGRTCIS